MKSVGKYTYGHEDITILSWGEGAQLTIGAFCSIARGCKIYLGGNHRSDWVTTYPFGHIHQKIFNKFNGVGHPKTNGDVIIGNDVWIGDNVTIMSGIEIGNGAIIANNSHVVKKVEAYEIVGGNPAKHIKYRFDKEIIKQLLEIRWWEMDDEKINTLTPLLCSNSVEKFIDTVFPLS